MKLSERFTTERFLWTCAIVALLAMLCATALGCAATVSMSGGSSTVSREIVEPETTTTTTWEVPK